MIRYDLAAALGELGRNHEALTQLDQLLATATNPSWIDEVRPLRDRLAAR